MVTPAPEVTLRSRQSDRASWSSIELHVSSPRSAPNVLLRIDQHVDEVTVSAQGLTPTSLRLTDILPGRWPAEVRFGDLPAEGVDITLRIPGQGPLRISMHDLTPGLPRVPGFIPRPAGIERSPRASGDATVVARTYEF